MTQRESLCEKYYEFSKKGRKNWIGKAAVADLQIFLTKAEIELSGGVIEGQV